MTTAAASAAVTVLAGERSATVAARRGGGGEDLWVRSAELTAVGWEMKPEGICAGEVCVPLTGQSEKALVNRHEGQDWLNVAAFAKHVGQPVARSEDGTVWSFGAPRHEWEQWSAGRAGEMAPDFSLPDVNGRLWSLGEFRKKKVFLVTWASW